MSITVALVLGLIIGWLIEWVIDWFYWRRPRVEPAAAEPVKVSVPIVKERYRQTPENPDDLTVIKGIGPVISKRLNDAGIHTYEQLASLTLDEFEEALGDLLQRFINERAILRQARELATKKLQG